MASTRVENGGARAIFTRSVAPRASRSASQFHPLVQLPLRVPPYLPAPAGVAVGPLRVSRPRTRRDCPGRGSQPTAGAPSEPPVLCRATRPCPSRWGEADCWLPPSRSGWSPSPYPSLLVALPPWVPRRRTIYGGLRWQRFSTQWRPFPLFRLSGSTPEKRRCCAECGSGNKLALKVCPNRTSARQHHRRSSPPVAAPIVAASKLGTGARLREGSRFAKMGHRNSVVGHPSPQPGPADERRVVHLHGRLHIRRCCRHGEDASPRQRHALAQGLNDGQLVFRRRAVRGLRLCVF